MDMLEEPCDNRVQQLNQLKNFINTVNKEIGDIVSTLGWTLDSITNANKGYLTCPYDSSHQLTEASLNDHLASCQWKSEGYEKSDIPLSEPSYPTDSPFCIKFDETLQAEVLRKAKEQNAAMKTGMGERLIPHTSNRLLIDFTSEERKALYDYTIAHTAKPDIGQDIKDISNIKTEEKEEKEISSLELMIQERNLKRRRTKHKGVHTNKKSHTEIIREVISQQMEVYTNYILRQNHSEYVTEDHGGKRENSGHKTIKEGIEHLHNVYHSSRNNDNLNFREKNNIHNAKKESHLNKDYTEKKEYHQSTKKDRWERCFDEYDEMYKRHKHSKHRKSSHSRERKSHKKDKYSSKDRHKDNHHERKHKSRDQHRDKTSSERHYSKHSDHKRAKIYKDY